MTKEQMKKNLINKLFQHGAVIECSYLYKLLIEHYTSDTFKEKKAAATIGGLISSNWLQYTVKMGKLAFQSM